MALLSMEFLEIFDKIFPKTHLTHRNSLDSIMLHSYIVMLIGQPKAPNPLQGRCFYFFKGFGKKAKGEIFYNRRLSRINW